jgi:cytochrome c
LISINETRFRPANGRTNKLESIMQKLLILTSALLAWTGATVGAARADEATMVAAGHVMFDRTCRICHADDPAFKTYGPPLVGIVGRKAGSFPGYAYSDALKNAGITWTVEAIRAWMASNTEMMPGTKMRHVGVTDPAEQDIILAYLKSISP